MSDRPFHLPIDMIYNPAGNNVLVVLQVINTPLQPEHPEPPSVRKLDLDHPEIAVPRLMVVIERLMDSLLRDLAEKGRAVTAVQVAVRP